MILNWHNCQEKPRKARWSLKTSLSAMTEVSAVVHVVLSLHNSRSSSPRGCFFGDSFFGKRRGALGEVKLRACTQCCACCMRWSSVLVPPFVLLTGCAVLQKQGHVHLIIKRAVHHFSKLWLTTCAHYDLCCMCSLSVILSFSTSGYLCSSTMAGTYTLDQCAVYSLAKLQPNRP